MKLLFFWQEQILYQQSFTMVTTIHRVLSYLGNKATHAKLLFQHSLIDSYPIHSHSFYIACIGEPSDQWRRKLKYFERDGEKNLGLRGLIPPRKLIGFGPCFFTAYVDKYFFLIFLFFSLFFSPIFFPLWNLFWKKAIVKTNLMLTIFLFLLFSELLAISCLWSKKCFIRINSKCILLSNF